MPGHRPQATQAVRMHCAASAATRPPRMVPGASFSSLSTAWRSLSRHFRLWSADDAMSAATANSPASFMTTTTRTPQRPPVEDADHNRERAVREHGYFAPQGDAFSAEDGYVGRPTNDNRPTLDSQLDGLGISPVSAALARRDFAAYAPDEFTTLDDGDALGPARGILTAIVLSALLGLGLFAAAIGLIDILSGWSP